MQENNWNELDYLTVEQLGFSALSDGLGFSKPQKAAQPATVAGTGTGATLAGPVLPVLETPRLAPKIIKPLQTPAPTVISQPSASAALRSAALGLDLLIALAPWSIALLFVVPEDVRQQWFLQEKLSFLPLIGAYIFAYFLLTESLGGQSPGKMLLKLQIVEDDRYQKPISFRAALPRLLVFLLSLAPFGLVLLTGFLDSKGRSLHDKVTGTIIRRI
jgi:uncharacterized RDD family membrane protein YckC